MYTVRLQVNGAVSKVNKKFISHLIRAKRTPSAAATLLVSYALPAVRFWCVLRGTVITLQNGAHRKPFPAAGPSWKLTPRPLSKYEKRTVGSAWETWTVAAADGVRCARVRWEINFLLTFEPAPFICKRTVCVCVCVCVYIYPFYMELICVDHHHHHHQCHFPESIHFLKCDLTAFCVICGISCD